MSDTRISIRLPDDLAKEFERVRKKFHKTRSEMIRAALKNFMLKTKKGGDKVWWDDEFFDFRKMQRAMNRMMAQMMRGFDRFPAGFEPMTDIRDEGDRFVIQLDMPGVEKKDIQIFADEQTIEIRAEREKREIEQRKNFYRQERAYAGYHRVLPMPAKIDPKHIEAEYKNGVLTLKVAKKEKSPKKVKVKVK